MTLPRGFWDPYPGTVSADMPCAECGEGPIVHVGLNHDFVASWPPIEGLAAEVPEP